MRILCLCYEYPPLGGGGGRVAQTVAQGLAARGHEVRVQTAALGWRSQQEEEGGVLLRRTASGRRRADTCTVAEMGLFLLTSFAPAWREVRRWRPQVLHAHFALPTGVLAYALHRLTGVPYVLTAHLGDVPGGVPEQTDRLFRLVGPLAGEIWRRAAGATAVSGFVQHLAEAAYGRPVRRILNGLELRGRPALESLRPGRPRRLLFAGRFNAQKRAPWLLRALALVQGVPWRLRLIGDGPERPEAERLARELGLAELVCFLGWQPAATVAAEMAEADVLCLPSSSEGLPVVAVEALRHGLAIAACQIPGVQDVVRAGENGFLTPLEEPAAYAAALEGLLGSEEELLARRQASWQRAGQFELGGILQAYEEVLQAAAR